MGIEAGGIVGIVGADDGPEDAKDYKHSPLTSRLLVKNSDPTILVQNIHTLVYISYNSTYVIYSGIRFLLVISHFDRPT